METYLTFIGTMNALGTVLLLAALDERFADRLLRRWTAFVPADTPFRYSPYARLWLWWAIIGTGVFAGWNLVAADWPEPYVRVILYGDIAAYAAFELLAVAGSLSGRYGPGVHFAHVLWIGQAGWGVWVALG